MVLSYRHISLLLWLLIAVGTAAKPSKSESDEWMLVAIGTDTLRLRLVAGGDFLMGATPDQKDAVLLADKPAHWVQVESYYIAETEVTNKLWYHIMPDWKSPDGWLDPTQPVNYVTYHDCLLFLSRLKDSTELDFRLPTEAEWEYAARGGLYSKSYRFAGANHADEVGWTAQNSGNKRHAVMQLRQNELGLYDMTGNVSEWCSDEYRPYTLAGSSIGDTAQAANRVVRGGSFDNCPANSHISVRSSQAPDAATNYIGLRIALSTPHDSLRSKGTPASELQVRVAGKRMRFVYVAFSTPYYIAKEDITCAQWTKLMKQAPEGSRGKYAIGMHSSDRLLFAERCRRQCHYPIAVCSKQQWDTAVQVGVVAAGIAKDERGDRPNGRKLVRQQKKRQHLQKLEPWAELIGRKVVIPEDKVLEVLNGNPADQYPLRLVIL